MNKEQRNREIRENCIFECKCQEGEWMENQDKGIYYLLTSHFIETELSKVSSTRIIIQCNINNQREKKERERDRKKRMDICHQVGWAERSRSLWRKSWNACCRLESSGETEESDRRINLRRSPRNRSRDLSAEDDPAVSRVSWQKGSRFLSFSLPYWGRLFLTLPPPLSFLLSLDNLVPPLTRYRLGRLVLRRQDVAPRPRCSRTRDSDRLIGDLAAPTRIRTGSTFSSPRVIASDSWGAPIRDQTSRQGANSRERKINSVEAR